MKQSLQGRRIAERVELTPGNSGPAEWASVDPEKVLDAIQAASTAGGAIRFGLTRDGGAYSIGIYGDGEPYTLYVRPSEDIGRALDSITAGYQDLRHSQPAAPKMPKNGR